MRSCQSGESLMSRHQLEDSVKSRAATAAAVIAGTPLATMESEWLVLHKTEGDWFDVLLWEKKARVTESNLIYITYYYCFVIVFSQIFKSFLLFSETIHNLLFIIVGVVGFYFCGRRLRNNLDSERRERNN